MRWSRRCGEKTALTAMPPLRRRRLRWFEVDVDVEVRQSA
jgi:hypothetical protein